jgi:hypothetical protein
MADQLDEPIDCIHSRINRIRSLPPAEEFEDGGRFSHLQVPFFPPVPIAILQYLYGDDINPEEVSYRDKAEILRSLHKTINPTVLYCSCGMHILKSQETSVDDGPEFSSQEIKPFSGSDVTG